MAAQLARVVVASGAGRWNGRENEANAVVTETQEACAAQSPFMRSAACPVGMAPGARRNVARRRYAAKGRRVSAPAGRAARQAQGAAQAGSAAAGSGSPWLGRRCS